MRNLRSKLRSEQFQRFKIIKAQLGARTNGEAVKELMDLFEENRKDEQV